MKYKIDIPGTEKIEKLSREIRLKTAEIEKIAALMTIHLNQAPKYDDFSSDSSSGK